MDPSALQDLIRRSFLVGYDCGRADERDDMEAERDIPDNVVSLDALRDQTLRRNADA